MDSKRSECTIGGLSRGRTENTRRGCFLFGPPETENRKHPQIDKKTIKMTFI